MEKKQRYGFWVSRSCDNDFVFFYLHIGKRMKIVNKVDVTVLGVMEINGKLYRIEEHPISDEDLKRYQDYEDAKEAKEAIEKTECSLADQIMSFASKPGLWADFVKNVTPSKEHMESMFTLFITTVPISYELLNRGGWFLENPTIEDTKAFAVMGFDTSAIISGSKAIIRHSDNVLCGANNGYSDKAIKIKRLGNNFFGSKSKK